MLNPNRLRTSLLENLYLVTGLVGSLFLIFILFMPSVTAIPNLNSQISLKSAELKELRSKSAILNSLIANQSVLKSNLKLVDAAIPSKDNVPTLMTQIQKIASDSGVTLKALQFGTPSLVTSSGDGRNASNKLDRNIKKVALQAVAEGSFSNIQSFLKNIENSSRLIVVESVSFESRKGSSGINSTMALASYYLDLHDDSPLSIDLGSEELKSTLVKIRNLKIYEPEVTFSGVGKANPFE